MQKPNTTLLIAALGIVFGDIGTSPIYTFKESFLGAQLSTSLENIYGIASITFWLMVLVVTFKYVTFVMRADNQGEGGILALYGLLINHLKKGKSTKIVTILGLTGAALFWGDSVITPAISVLSAVEGLTYINPKFQVWVLPGTIAILLGLFMYQKHGTEKIGVIFGPVMLIWFLVLGGLGMYHIIEHPQVLVALNPMYALNFLYDNPSRILILFGFCILVVTGVEALYADMGHFGKSTISYAWILLVFPCLTLNYMGQAAALIKQPQNIEYLFFSLVPESMVIPFVVLTTVATIIASQAVISGIYSLSVQAIHLGLLPPFKTIYTSEDNIGHIYVPMVNFIMAVHVIFIVMTFQSSAALASMYGLAVSAIMVMTTILILWVAKSVWMWGNFKVFVLASVIIPVDTVLFAANLHKLDGGAALPVLVGMILLFIMFSWRHGEAVKKTRTELAMTTTESFVKKLSSSNFVKTKAIGVYLSPYPEHMPHTFFHAVEHIMAAPKKAYGMSIIFHKESRIKVDKRIEIKKYTNNFSHITVNYGYMQSPRMADIIRVLRNHDIELGGEDTTFYVASSIPVVKAHNWIEFLQENCYVFFYRNLQPFVLRIKIVDDKVIQICRRVVLD